MAKFPSPLEIKALAEDYGYVERQEEASLTLFFQEFDTNKKPNNSKDKKGKNEKPILINIFYTTGGIMTKLPHTSQTNPNNQNNPNNQKNSSSGYNSLWRSNTFSTLESLALLFQNPRMYNEHPNTGIISLRGCAKCGFQKKKKEFSFSQWKGGMGRSVCIECVSGGNGGNGGARGNNGSGGKGRNDGGVGGITAGVAGMKVEEVGSGATGASGARGGGRSGGRGATGGSGSGAIPDNIASMEAFPVLSSAALEQHNRQYEQKDQQSNGNAGKKGKERRQFNCPLCPKQGRGKHVFFKRVPINKPIVKCPKCKNVNNGDVERLYPIPKGKEKGYGHFRCTKCKGTWGSSRAISSIGQQCQVCALAGNPNQFVKPFRMEVVIRGGTKGGGITGGGPRPAGRRMRRVPREVIHEDTVDGTSYSESDSRRFQSRGGSAMGGGGGVGRSYDFVSVKEEDDGESTIKTDPDPVPSKPKFTHKCQGCATGICRSRKLPISGIHDVDGDTVSTSGSVVTDSELDKAEFRDVDIDFDDWEDDDLDVGDEWVKVED